MWIDRCGSPWPRSRRRRTRSAEARPCAGRDGGFRAGRELRQRVVYFDSGFRNHAATVKRITNCGELHRIGDVVIGSHLQQRTAIVSVASAKRRRAFARTCGARPPCWGHTFAPSIAARLHLSPFFSMRFTAMCAHFGFRVFPPRFTPLDHRLG